MAYPKMDKTVKKAWVAELRSGDYKQGRLQLRNGDNEFCCLGVLCNVHAKNNPEFAKTQTNPRRYGGELCYPPSNVAAWAGLSEVVGDRINDMNDNRGKTFNQIADWIVKNV